MRFQSYELQTNTAATFDLSPWNEMYTADNKKIQHCVLVVSVWQSFSSHTRQITHICYISKAAELNLNTLFHLSTKISIKLRFQNYEIQANKTGTFI